MSQNRMFIIFAGLIMILTMGCATAEIVGGPVASGTLSDGVYDGQAQSGSLAIKATVKVAVTIADQRISQIKIIEHKTLKGQPAEAVIPDRIVAAQSTRVDAVSGATLSSRTIMNAVEDALQKAAR